MAEYKLSFTAADINSKLGKIDGLSVDVESLKNDINNSNLSGLNSTVNSLSTAMQSTVKTQVQTLTNEQKTQARDNIDAASNSDMNTRFSTVENNIDSLERSIGSLEVTHVNDKTVLQNSVDGKVPLTRTVNGKALSSDVVLSASDVGAIPSTEKGVTNGIATLDENGKLVQMPSAADVGAATPSYVDALALNANKLRAENTISDVLHVDLNNPDSDANRSAYFNSAAFNIPSPTVAFGIRDVNFIMAGFVVVTAYCFITDSSARVYYNAFNKNAGTWMGWREHATTDTALMKSEKPSGSYTGNGDATARVINTGGIGSVAIVSSASTICILCGCGAACFNVTSGNTIMLPYSEAYFADGVINLATANGVINYNGAWYYYQVL